MGCIYEESVINSKLLVNYLREMCKNFAPPYKTDSLALNRRRLESNRKITTCLSQVKRLVKEGICDLDTFKTEILNTSKLELVHAEIFWYLEVYDLISLSEIVQHHVKSNNKNIIEHLGVSIFNCILKFEPKQSMVRQKLLTSYLKTIFPNKNIDPVSDKICLGKTVLNLLSSNFVEFYKQDSLDKSSYSNVLDVSNLIELFNEAQLDFGALNKIFVHLTISLLEGSCQTLKSVFLQQNSKVNFKDQKVYEFFKSVSRYFEIGCLLNELNVLLLDKSKRINWNNALSLISYLGEHYPDGWKSIRSLCDCLLKHSFQELNPKLLSYVFIIARQGCFVKSKGAFPNYLQWFGSSFSSKSVAPLNSKQKCCFFFNFLTDIMPYDSVQYLKVHVNRIPLVPAGCEGIVAEYTNQVNAHLSDLNASSELGICENDTEKSAAAFDVENVIKHFQETNSILNIVFQSAMFNKKYFEKKFLVELLSKYDGKNSPRHKIITKLNSLGKIPKSSFKKYQTLEKINASKK